MKLSNFAEALDLAHRRQSLVHFIAALQKTGDAPLTITISLDGAETGHHSSFVLGDTSDPALKRQILDQAHGVMAITSAGLRAVGVDVDIADTEYVDRVYPGGFGDDDDLPDLASVNVAAE